MQAEQTSQDIDAQPVDMSNDEPNQPGPSKDNQVSDDEDCMDIKVGEFVAVKFPKRSHLVVYMAMVMDKGNAADQVVLKFMQKTQKERCYSWPDDKVDHSDRRFTHPVEDLICKLEPPDFEISQRQVVYKFNSQDMLKVQRHLHGEAVVFK
ncbi:uncharacterized protein [Amphiura filiformis]|uniref:uncharacterized protein n=1 Tax=Amphiura filiformis TaxID=82378 RepID=UPI003B224FF8